MLIDPVALDVMRLPLALVLAIRDLIIGVLALFPVVFIQMGA